MSFRKSTCLGAADGSFRGGSAARTVWSSAPELIMQTKIDPARNDGRPFRLACIHQYCPIRRISSIERLNRLRNLKSSAELESAVSAELHSAERAKITHTAT